MAYRERLRRYVVAAGLISALVFALCVLTGQPLLALLYWYPVALMALLLGTRAGIASGALAAGLALLGGALGGSDPGAATYVGLGAFLVLLGGAGGLARRTLSRRAPAPAAAEAGEEETPPWTALLKKIVALLFLFVEVLTVHLSGLAAGPSQSPRPTWQPPAPLELVLPAPVEAPMAAQSVQAALVRALSGELGPSQLRLEGVDPARRLHYQSVLEQVNAVAIEAKVVGGETLEADKAVCGAVAEDRLDPTVVIEAVSACGDAESGIRAVAHLQGLVEPLQDVVEIIEKVEEVKDFVERVKEVAEALSEAERSREKRRRRRRRPWPAGKGPG
jgi:hypothetical protein